MTDLLAFINARLDDDGETLATLDSTALNGIESTAGWSVREYVERGRAEVEAKRLLLDDITAERHMVVEDDCWYTCAAATEERDGGESCDDDAGDECRCGRDARVERRLRLLALPYADHPDYREEWRVTL